MKLKRVLSGLILLFAAMSLNASDEAAYFITHADDAAIMEMASVRGMDTSLSASQLRSQLLDGQEGISQQNVDLTQDGGSYSLEIVSADSMSVSGDGIVTLSGNASVRFTMEGESSRTLYADRMLLDPSAGRLTAYGNVRYEDDDQTSSIGNISADIVTYLYDTGDLLISGGTTSTQRQNNEGEDVTFYTTGSLLNYRSADGGLFFQDGYLTSNPDTAYSSISAQSLALLEGGDMFLTNAYLSIGRVPLLYLPFFFYPGSRLAINPSFGFASDRGMFLSTTTELFGTYPKFSSADESSFASLLRSESDASMVSNGLYYTQGEPQSAFARWAAESESYFALLADVYQNAGFLLGFDTLVKPAGVLSISSETAFILSPAQSYYDSNFRYYTLNEANLSSSFGTLDLSFPYYSDPYVLRNYSNRLTSFSIDSVFGSYQTFPSTRSSTITSYNASLTGSLYLPSSAANSFVQTLRLSSITANASFDWNSIEQRYEVSDITLPSFSFTLSGDIFSFTTDREREEGSSSQAGISDYFILSDPLLYDLFVLTPRRQALSTNTEYGVSLSYSLTERLSNSFEYDMDQSEIFDREFSSDTSLRLQLEAVMGNRFSFGQTLTPSYSYDYDESDRESRDHSFSLLSATSASIPVLGLSYNFSAYLYRIEQSEDTLGQSRSETVYRFDSDNVRIHSLTFSKSFGSVDNYGQLTPSLSYTLPPLSASVQPAVSYRIGGVSTSFSWAFKEDSTDGRYKSDDIRWSFALTYPHLTFNVSALYESGEDRERLLDPLSLTSSLTLRSEDRAWSVTEYLDFDAYSSAGRNIVNDLRTVISIPSLDFTFNFTTDGGSLVPEYFEMRSSVSDFSIYMWKNRIRFSLILDGRLRYDFLNPYSSSLSLKTGLSLSIAEFLDLNIALTTANNGFYRYMDNGSFSFALMAEDLLRSFDFFGDGRYNTQFNMEAFDIELVHYMDDWDLHFRYTASLENDDMGNYRWNPSFAVYLRWATIPDLKVDQTWSQTSSGSWTRSSSLYTDG